MKNKYLKNLLKQKDKTLIIYLVIFIFVLVAMIVDYYIEKGSSSGPSALLTVTVSLLCLVCSAIIVYVLIKKKGTR